MTTKVCTKCSQALSLDNFTKDKQKKDGLRSSCKLCAKVYQKQRTQYDKKERHKKFEQEFKAQQIEGEEWLPIKDFESYLISNKARVYSLPRKGGGGFVKQHERNGYLFVSLTKDDKNYPFALHRLLALHFIPRIEGKEVVDHINRNRKDNSLSNLRWVNCSENSFNREVKGSVYIDKRTIGDKTYEYWRVQYVKPDGEVVRKRFKTKEEAEKYRAELCEQYPR